jgi:hypothetical protein
MTLLHLQEMRHRTCQHSMQRQQEAGPKQQQARAQQHSGKQQALQAPQLLPLLLLSKREGAGQVQEAAA